MAAEGVLVVDKPAGLTSHDVVAAVRRILDERRLGHTGTLDPMATGVLPLVCGRATRLVRFLTASDKEYEAAVRFGVVTDTLDISGRELARSNARPDRPAVDRGLAALSGSYLQMPPAFSAKKVAGERAYAIARRDEAVELTPVPVTVTATELLDFDGDTAHVRVVCSAGFYVRSFAHALGELVGTGACLAALRRTRSGAFTLADSVTLDDLGQQPQAAARRVIPIDRLLSGFPAVTLTDEDRRRVSHGQAVAGVAEVDWVRLVDGEGHLVALATRGAAPGSLHPAVVLI